MSRRERHIYENGIVIAAIFIIATVIVMTIPQPQNVAFAAQVIEGEEIIEESAEAPENGIFDANSAMPCVDAESFRRWYETYESEASEETRSDDVGADYEEAGTNEDPQPEPVTEMENASPTLYKIAGQEIDASLQVKLYQHLQEAGIPWWYEIGLCQMFQESSGNVFAVSKDGRDMGILQFRAQYWDWSSGDIFDIDAQMRRYAHEMSTRFNNGLSVDEAISRHMTSDHVSTINQKYVSDVKRWLSEMEIVNE